MSFYKQVSINSIGMVAFLLAQWLISVLLVRMGGFADVGVFSLAMSVANIFSTIANFGIRNYQISDAGNRFTQKQYLLAKFTATAISFAAFGIYLLIDTSYSAQNRWAILLYLLYQNLSTISEVMLGSLQLRNKLYLSGCTALIKAVLCFFAFISSYALWKNLLLSLGLMSAASILAVVTFDMKWYANEHMLEKSAISDDLSNVCRVIRSCFPLMVSSMLPYISTAVPRRAILVRFGETYLGYYSSLFTPTVIITTVVPAVLLGIVPKMAEAWTRGEKRKFGRQLMACAGGIVFFTATAFLCAVIAGKPVIKVVFGEEILQYYNLLYIAIAVSGLAALKSVGDSALLCMRRTGMVTFCSATETAVIIALADGFVSSMGINGAAYVMLVGYGVHLLLQTAVIISKTRRHVIYGKGKHNK